MRSKGKKKRNDNVRNSRKLKDKDSNDRSNNGTENKKKGLRNSAFKKIEKIGNKEKEQREKDSRNRKRRR